MLFSGKVWEGHILQMYAEDNFGNQQKNPVIRLRCLFELKNACLWFDYGDHSIRYSFVPQRARKQRKLHPQTYTPEKTRRQNSLNLKMMSFLSIFCM